MDHNNEQFSDLISLGAALREPWYLPPSSAWLEHIPFAFWLVEQHRPGTIVELGVHTGLSYCAFCQAVAEPGLEARCYGVDTFEGDVHAGMYGPDILRELRAYHDPLYAGFSTLIPATFDAAVKRFNDGAIDLLHMDGCHFYERVKHDFETWMPKLSPRAIVIFHDTNERQREFGVFKLWAELAGRHPSFEFFHGHGLGVLAVGGDLNPAMADFFSSTETRAAVLRQFFSLVGSRLTLKIQVEEMKKAALALETRLRGRVGRVKSLEMELLAKQPEIESLELETIRLRRIIEDAQRWQRSWLKRALHRWRPPDAGVRTPGFFRRFERSVRQRCNWMGAKVVQGETIREAPCAVVETRNEESQVADRIITAIRPWFDREFYLLENPDVARSGADPLLHFYEHGEQEGRRPRADFDPAYYLANNLDVRYIQSESAIESAFAKHPFFHYVAAGRAEGRDAVPVLEPFQLEECDLPENHAPSSVAMIVHLFYPDIWGEIQEVIAKFPPGTRLYITLAEGHSSHLLDAIHAKYPDAQIEIMANRGRDVLPFLSQLKKAQADNVRVALKIHTKKSLGDPPRYGDEWRASLYEDLAPSARYVNAIIKTFDSQSRTGVLIPYCHCLSLLRSLENNRPALDKLTAALGVPLAEEELGKTGFPAGTMFWFRPEALFPLTKLGLSANDFPEETGQMDGTLAHAVERVIGLAARAANFETGAYKWKTSPRQAPVARDDSGEHVCGNGAS